MIHAIAFDLDNTLIDFMKFKKQTAKAAAKAMTENGLEGTQEQIEKEIFSIYDKYGIEYQKTFSRLLIDHGLKPGNTFEKIQQAGINAYLKKKFTALKPYPDVIPTLKKLKEKGLILAIVTDAPRNKAWQRLNMCGLQDMFDHVVTLDDTGKLKPDMMPFTTLLEKLNLPASEVMMVGDNLERDVKGAHAAGMKTAYAAYGGGFEENVKVDYILKEFGDVLQVL